MAFPLSSGTRTWVRPSASATAAASDALPVPWGRGTKFGAPRGASRGENPWFRWVRRNGETDAQLRSAVPLR